MNKHAMIVALDEEGGFAKDKKIPWHYSEDFKWFKQVTESHICVMGRHTYEEINEKVGDKGKESVLPNRTCFVLSNTLTELDNAFIIKDYDEVFKHPKVLEQPDKIVFCIGGAQLFEQQIHSVDGIHTTLINKNYNCDQFFPTHFLTKLFVPAKTYKATDEDLRFVTWTRKQ